MVSRIFSIFFYTVSYCKILLLVNGHDDEKPVLPKHKQPPLTQIPVFPHEKGQVFLLEHIRLKFIGHCKTPSKPTVIAGIIWPGTKQL